MSEELNKGINLKRKLKFSKHKKERNIKQSRTEDIEGAFETLEESSIAFSNLSKELLSPIKETEIVEPSVMNTPTNMVIPKNVPETEDQSAPSGDTCEKFADVKAETKDCMIDRLKEEVEMAMIFSMACYKKMEAVLDLITSDDEIRDFKRRSERKIREVFRVAKKGTVVELMTEYRIVDDVVQTTI